MRQGEGTGARIWKVLILNFGRGGLNQRGRFLRGGADARIHGRSE